MKRFLVALLLSAFLFGTYYLATFPILGLHGPACLCDQCLDEFEKEKSDDHDNQ